MRMQRWFPVLAMAGLLVACGGGVEDPDEGATAESDAAEDEADATPTEDDAAASDDETEDMADDGDPVAEDPVDADADAMEDGGDADAGADSTDDGGGEASGADADTTLTVADSDFGEILADGEGMTLYLFDPDERGESTCYEECASSWPPLVGSVEVDDGVDESLVGSTERTDGTTQTTYDGWPLYYFAGDAEPGDVNGQGVQDVWWVVAADGARVTEMAGAAPAY